MYSSYYVGVDRNYFGLSEALAVYFFRNIKKFENYKVCE